VSVALTRGAVGLADFFFPFFGCAAAAYYLSEAHRYALSRNEISLTHLSYL
jgi:hypothetical protein